MEMEALNKLQDFYKDTYRSMLVDCKYDKYQFILRREQLAQRIRDKFILIHGWKEDATCDNGPSVESC